MKKNKHNTKKFNTFIAIKQYNIYYHSFNEKQKTEYLYNQELVLYLEALKL